MDPKDELIRKRAHLLNAVRDAAHRGEIQEVFAATERLERVESLIARYEKLLQDISELERPGAQPPESKETNPADYRSVHRTPFRETNASRNIAPRTGRLSKSHSSDQRAQGVSGRDIGSTIRADFLKRLSESGIELRHIRGSLFSTRSGHKVGIAVATERQPGRWFLGLPYDGFDHAVLLCKRATGEVVEICLPKIFFDEHGSRMSQSGGQVKFNVARRDGGYAVLVPGTDGISDPKFLRGYAFLK